MGSSGSGSSWLKSIGGSPPKRGQASSSRDVELTRHKAVNPATMDASGQDNTRPVMIKQQQRQEVFQSRCGSSGSGLPSALGTPPNPADVKGEPPTSSSAEEQQQQQQQQQQPASADTPKMQKGVRWLPGLEASPAQGSQPSAGSTAGRGGLVPGSTGHSNVSRPEGAGTGSWDPSAADGSERGASSSSSSRAGPLPPADDPQLSNYLTYLLKGQHPHKFMYFPGWGLTEASCAAVGAFLQRDRRIKVMTLSGNSITDDGIELIAEGLAHNSTLLSLDLSDNAISSVGAVELAEALHSDKCRVAELLLMNNCIGDEGADALAAAVASSSCLKKLNLCGNPISQAQLDVVQHVLKTREYKLSALRQHTKDKTHLRKCSSGLQFDIELIEGQARSKSTHYFMLKDPTRLPPAMAVAALIEPKDPLESSIGMQAADLLAELPEKAPQCAAGNPAAAAATAADAAAAPTDLNSQDLSLTAMLAHRLACRGYDVVLRTCFPLLDIDAAGKEDSHQQQQHHHHHQQRKQRHSSGSELLASGLRHTFVRVSQPVPAEEAVVLPTVIVDPLFRDEFEMPHATDRFTSTLDALPRVLCLAESRLWHLVQLLCTETTAAFKESGLSLPPWRATSAVMDKWLSVRFHDTVVDADTSPQDLERAVHQCAPPLP